MDRQQVDGKRMGKGQIDGKRIDETRIDQKQINQKQVDQKQIDQKQVDGKQIGKRQIVGKQMDKRQTDGNRIDKTHLDKMHVDKKYVDKKQIDSRFAEWMEQGFGELKRTLTGVQMEQFWRFYELLIEWNQVMNLTAITDMEEVVSKHFVDSCALVKSGISLEGQNMIDVGTGAGFPGIPLKILFPDLRVTLLDSLNKRIRFLEEVCSQLGLQNVELIHGRAEDYGRDVHYREQYDLCVSRAVANLSSLSEYCIPFVKVGGCFISYKSGKVEEERIEAEAAVKKLGGKIGEIHSFHLPLEDALRYLVMIEKVKGTAKQYPRKAGMPAKEPLK